MFPTGSPDEVNQNWSHSQIPEKNKAGTGNEQVTDVNIDPSLTKVIDHSNQLKNAAALKKATLSHLADHSKQVSKLFKSSAAMEKNSSEKAMVPSQGDNANDVYMTKFTQKGLQNVVFKPGVEAAIRSKICFGLVRLYKSLENVIVAAKNGCASVISRKDYNTAQTEVYNPENGCFYLIKNNPERTKLWHKKENNFGYTTGKLKNENVTLEPVDNSPGFYQIMSDGKLDECFCMQVSKSLPTNIDTYVEKEASWAIVEDNSVKDSTENEKIYLVPLNEIIKISVEKVPIETEEGLVETEEEPSTQEQMFVIIGEVKYSILYNDLTKKNQLFPSDNFSNKDYKKILENYLILNYEEPVEQYDWDDDDLEEAVQSNEEEETIQSTDENKGQVLVLVPKTLCVPYKINAESLIYEGKKYEVEETEDSTFLLVDTADEEENDQYIIFGEKGPKCDLITIKENGTKYVKRNDQDYEVTTNANKSIEVVGKHIDGMVQLKVENLFQKSKPEKKTLNILYPSKEREEFYRRIDMTSFTQAFIATILLRPQDGKISDLDESNVLFQAMPGLIKNDNGEDEIIPADPLNPLCPLCPIVIDLDETLPPSNDYSQNPDFIGKGQLPNIHAVRNGLMGFPHARMVLTGEQKLQAENTLKEIIATSDKAVQFLETFKNQKSFTEKHVTAYKDVINKMDLFLQETGTKDWTLEALFFSVFPEYQKQWTAFGEMSNEEKALNIGFVAPDLF